MQSDWAWVIVQNSTVQLFHLTIFFLCRNWIEFLISTKKFFVGKFFYFFSAKNKFSDDFPQIKITQKTTKPLKSPTKPPHPIISVRQKHAITPITSPITPRQGMNLRQLQNLLITLVIIIIIFSPKSLIPELFRHFIQFFHDWLAAGY